MNFSVAEIAQRIQAEVRGDGSAVVVGVGSIDDGSPDEIGFLADAKYRKQLSVSRLGAVIVDAPLDEVAAVQLVVTDVRSAWRKVAALFEPTAEAPSIHPSATIAETARIGEGAFIAAGVVIGDGVVIGAHCRIAMNVVIEAGVRIGDEARLMSGCQILSGSVLGHRVFVDSGAVIGSRGFGYHFEDGHWLPIPQLGGVRIGNDVDIGANTTIDRGAIDDTVVEDGAKLDNLIQVGHNVVIGADTIIAGACVIAGSVRFGRHCVVGGACVFTGHIEICDGAQFAGHSSISKSITHPDVYCSAFAAVPMSQWKRFVGKLKLFAKGK